MLMKKIQIYLHTYLIYILTYSKVTDSWLTETGSSVNGVYAIAIRTRALVVSNCVVTTVAAAAVVHHAFVNVYE